MTITMNVPTTGVWVDRKKAGARPMPEICPLKAKAVDEIVRKLDAIEGMPRVEFRKQVTEGFHWESKLKLGVE